MLFHRMEIVFSFRNMQVTVYIVSQRLCPLAINVYTIYTLASHISVEACALDLNVFHLAPEASEESKSHINHPPILKRSSISFNLAFQR